ncbi:hypothetical protein D5S17_01825 [Pseudonocardiaceae bacterium YIM PH 21723]|nr:hypothetical protein D5S17_01825 [Pseudonocardiaceae bacterium YIM PH 21723]
MPVSDPFGTAALRAGVLAAWRSSPTRFREDANAEEDLRYGGYRDRLFVELAQNASDAAASAGEPGVLRLTLVEDEFGLELRVANTGAPLSMAGVEALASLRASAKRQAQTVGQFGVGFAAVLAVSDEPRILSRTGGIAFSFQATAQVAAEIPQVAEELVARNGAVPVLRLAWPVDPEREEPLPAGFDTEVRLPLRDTIDRGWASQLLTACAEQAPDLLLALPWLQEIQVGELRWYREFTGDHGAGDLITLNGPQWKTTWLIRRQTGQLPAELLSTLGSENRERREFNVGWAIPISEDGTPLAFAEDVLHAPTPTDEQLSMPARLLATVPLDPSRRRILPGPAADHILAAAADSFLGLLADLPIDHAMLLVPAPGFPRSEVDAQLRELVIDTLQRSPWLPTVDGQLVPPGPAAVIDVYSPDLAGLLANVIPGLLPAELSRLPYSAAINHLGVPRLRLTEVLAAVAGLRRPVEWWAQFYTALGPLAEATPDATEELGALPVPLLDGRVVTGVRGVLLPEVDAETIALLEQIDVVGLRIAHPDLVHPLLARAGAIPAGAGELLDSDAVREAVENSVRDSESGVDTLRLVDLVLRLVEMGGYSIATHPWLTSLALPNDVGNSRRADELALPGAPLLDLLDAHAPVGVLFQAAIDRWPVELLKAVGVLDGFAVVIDENPVGPNHDLADEEEWWESIGGDYQPPARVVGVRDLDLVADEAWPRAITLLISNPDTLAALREPNGYTSWWLARFAKISGRVPSYWRLPGAEDIAGLYDPVPDIGLPEDLLELLGVRTGLTVNSAAEAAEMLNRLGDPARQIAVGTTLRAHGELIAAVEDGRFAADQVDLPAKVRSITGEAVDSAEAVILDVPWALAVWDGDFVVGLTDVEPARAELLADLLDLPLAGEQGPVEVITTGVVSSWSGLVDVVDTCGLLDLPVPDGVISVHQTLVVRADGENTRVSWWREDDVSHAEDNPIAIARALAWAVGRWRDRHLIADLLADPSGPTLLG